NADAATANLVWPIFAYVTQKIYDATDIRRHHRTCIGHRFDQRERRALVMRGQGDHIKRRIEILGIFPATDKDHIMFQAQRLALIFQLLAQQTVANDDETYGALSPAGRVDLLEPRDDVQKHLVVLDFSQAADDADENRVVRDTELMTESRASLCIVGKNVEIQTQRNHFDLPTPAHAKLLANLNALLFADNYQPVGNDFSQQPFDEEKQSRSATAIIAMKNVSVISVNKFALARLADQNAGSQPTI